MVTKGNRFQHCDRDELPSDQRFVNRANSDYDPIQDPQSSLAPITAKSNGRRPISAQANGNKRKTHRRTQSHESLLNNNGASPANEEPLFSKSGKNLFT